MSDPYIAERAIVLAAGRGERMRPLTDEMPKPMVRVDGRRIIDTLLAALVAADIPEIYVVRGYLGEKFDALKEEYPTLHFIDNPHWHEANNISSLLAAGALVENAFVVEGDLFLQNPSLLSREQQGSNYLAIPVKETTDWCFFPDEAGVIRRMAVGGTDCWKMVGISYWTTEDGRKLAQSIRHLYETPGGAARYWDEAALSADIEDFSVHVRACTAEDVQEIDTLAELETLRKSLKGKG
ncbi:phosphocholine cytidylyltransferase family protein [Selenomonas sputigena]|uniref:LicC family protein n=1 Tax=Selenomonas sputigena (strain ATCC 35185 / DSM 20758 / CCUG 44933 / VPI D19B-28) TaxID=546271 RepID=C9LY06_SELS3|nr:phosphocholine cytidylyltransferase family protein [Selenomonas sputigena]AEB99310.1 Nucleotidyl transferase [Selenomonas sputigena ATCC 35185]EEX76200.1 LicC family protein [Selenomonas sputigena ATCC 35185]